MRNFLLANFYLSTFLIGLIALTSATCNPKVNTKLETNQGSTQFKRMNLQYGYFANQGDPSFVKQMCCEVCELAMRNDFGLPGYPQTMNIRDFGRGKILTAGLQKTAMNPNAPKLSCTSEPNELTGCTCTYTTQESIVISEKTEELIQGIWINANQYAVHVKGNTAPGALNKESNSLKRQTCLADVKNQGLLSMFNLIASENNSKFTVKPITIDFPDIFVNNCQFSENLESCSCNILYSGQGLKISTSKSLGF